MIKVFKCTNSNYIKKLNFFLEKRRNFNKKKSKNNKQNHKRY